MLHLKVLWLSIFEEFVFQDRKLKQLTQRQTFQGMLKIDFFTNLSLVVTGRLHFLSNIPQKFDKFLLLGKLIVQGFSCTELQSSQKFLIPAFKAVFSLCLPQQPGGEKKNPRSKGDSLITSSSRNNKYILEESVCHGWGQFSSLKWGECCVFVGSHQISSDS